MTNPSKMIEIEGYELEEGFRCTDCDEMFPEDEDGQALYECSNCGNVWCRVDTDSHRCEQCGKFGAKLANHSHTDCNAEAEWVQYWECLEDDVRIAVAEWDGSQYVKIDDAEDQIDEHVDKYHERDEDEEEE